MHKRNIERAKSQNLRRGKIRRNKSLLIFTFSARQNVFQNDIFFSVNRCSVLFKHKNSISIYLVVSLQGTAVESLSLLIRENNEVIYWLVKSLREKFLENAFDCTRSSLFP